MTIGIRGRLVASAAALGLLFAATAVGAAPVSGTCTPAKVAFAASAITESATSSTTFVRVPEARVRLVQGGSQPSCVLVQFSAHAFASAGNSLVLKARLDKSISGLPRTFQFSGDDPGLYRTRTAVFIFPDIAPGAHTLQLLFRSVTGERVEIGVHNTIVHFAP